MPLWHIGWESFTLTAIKLIFQRWMATFGPSVRWKWRRWAWIPLGPHYCWRSKPKQGSRERGIVWLLLICWTEAWMSHAAAQQRPCWRKARVLLGNVYITIIASLQTFLLLSSLYCIKWVALASCTMHATHHIAFNRYNNCKNWKIGNIHTVECKRFGTPTTFLGNKKKSIISANGNAQTCHIWQENGQYNSCINLKNQ